MKKEDDVKSRKRPPRGIGGPLLSAIVYFILTSSSHIVTMAQSPLGSIDTTVVDNTGATVAGARVTAQNEANGYVANPCTTDSTGFCRIENLEAGSYQVKIEATGFKTSVFKVSVSVRNEYQLSAEISVGASEQEVVVTGEVPIIETNSSELSSAVTSDQAAELPLNGRNFTSFTLLAPGVMNGGVSLMPQMGGAGAPAVNGTRGRSNLLIVDGVEVSDQYRRLISTTESGVVGVPPTILPVDAVQELRISSDVTAESGPSSGSVSNLLIKSGGNDFHGAAFNFFRDDTLDARNFFDTTGRQNRSHYNNYGLFLGGPFKKNKLFWFVSYEGYRGYTEVTTLSPVPTDADFQVAILQLGGDPAINPAKNSVVNPIIRNLFSLCASTQKCAGGSNLWPIPTPSLTGNVLNSQAKAPEHISSDSVVGKSDFHFSERDVLSAYYTFSNAADISPLALAGGDFLPQTNTSASSRTHLASVSYLRTFGSSVSNDLRAGWNRFIRRSLDEDAPRIGNPAQSLGLQTGVTDSRDFGLPQLVVGSFASLGSSPFSNPRGRTSANWQIRDNVALIKGRHKMGIGYGFEHNQVESFNDVNFRGSLEFSTLAGFLAGRVARGSIQTDDSNRETAQNSQAIYFNDDIRLRRDFDVTLGLRWDYFGVIHEGRSLFSVYDPSQGLVLRPDPYHKDLDNFSPRLGLVWDVGSMQKTVVRAGGGVYFDEFPQDYLIGQFVFNTFDAGIAYNPISPKPILMSRSPVSVMQPGMAVFPMQSFTSDTRDVSTVGTITTPYVFNFNASLQRVMFKNTNFQVAYVGSAGHKLFRLRDINFPEVLGGGRPFDSASILSAFAPNHPFVVNQIETSANSGYNSLQVTYSQRRWRGWFNSVNWTWSHSIDDASDGYDVVPNEASPDNPRAPTRERANSNFDVRHRFVWTSVFDFPRMDALGWLGQGWQVGGILILSSGQPFSLNFGQEFDPVGLYDFILRPDVVGDVSLGTSKPFRLVNLAALRVPCTLDGLGVDVSHCIPGTLHFGNLPRNAFVGPDFRNLDLSLSKTTSIGERFKLHFRAEAFNLPNHPNFASPLLPTFVAKASFKGIAFNGLGGGAGLLCNTVSASDDCYLPSTATPDSATGTALHGGGGARTIELSLRLSF